jgi:excisionase family DNA binding protein
MDGDQLLTVQEVAARLRVNPETVRRWLRQGKLQGVMLGGDRAGYRIAESELRRLLEVGKEAA